MDASGAPAATAEPAAEEHLPEHAAAPAADLFPFTSGAPAVVVVTVEAPAEADEAAEPGGKALAEGAGIKSSKTVATFLAKHVEVRARSGAAVSRRRRSARRGARLRCTALARRALGETG